jgi:hypothetical protein
VRDFAGVEEMIVNFNERTGVGTSEIETWNGLAHCQEVSRGSLIERVCNFLERHPSFKNAHPNGSDFSWRSSTVAGVSSD